MREKHNKRNVPTIRSSAAEYLTFIAASGSGGVEAVYTDEKLYNTTHYNLKAIIAVGYKINSERAVQFRKWATQIIEEYAIKAVVIDSERRAYQKIADIFEQCSYDYDKDAGISRDFSRLVQNKMHYAVHRHTSAGIGRCVG
ncbi:MAG: virulence RhuM family protein [Clostridiaceae bacterium]|nr:virulence RhuM family protein [Clostridiaceae bacterium]